MKIPASYHQERLWFIDKFEAGHIYKSNPTYHNMPLIMIIKGDFDVKILERGIQFIIDRYPVLRTRIIEEEGKVHQMVCPEEEFKLEVISLSSEPQKEDSLLEQGISLTIDKVKEPFNVEKDLLVRGFLISLKDNLRILAFSFHHIICDRYSLKLFIDELLALYNNFMSVNPVSNPKIKAHYHDFSNWQHSLSEDVWESSLLFWKRKLKGKLQKLDLPTDRPKKHIHEYSDGRVEFEISGSLHENAF
jgi:NRPS condensation-like uncharacterized protein